MTTHDLLEGEDVEYQEYTLVKFESGETVFPMATLRPETVRGVTNAYIDPEGEYVEATVDGERWVVSLEAVEKLELQDHEIAVEREVAGEEYVGESVTNPITGDEVLVLPASFVDPDSGTGVVMSVPAHSPDDYLALEEAKADAQRLREYGIDPGRGHRTGSGRRLRRDPGETPSSPTASTPQTTPTRRRSPRRSTTGSSTRASSPRSTASSPARSSRTSVRS